MQRIRYPVVSGVFYESDKKSLLKRLEWCFLHELGPRRLPSKSPILKERTVGIISPHAGYMYSGPIAAHGYYELSIRKRPDIVIIIGPNHHGRGAPIAVPTHEVWRTPLGDVMIDQDFATKLVKESKLVEFDDEAHIYEHSIEVQLPFLQYVYGNQIKNIKVVPISMLLQNPEVSDSLGKAIKSLGDELGYYEMLIASTDFTHYESQKTAYYKDKIAIDAIIEMNLRRLYDVVIENSITMCGLGPVMTLISYVLATGEVSVRLLKYSTSGDITGDYSSVVGYASIIFVKSEG